MPVEPQPTPEEVELAADAIAKVWGYSNLAAADSVQDGDPYAVRKSARAVLAALAEAGRLRDPRGEDEWAWEHEGGLYPVDEEFARRKVAQYGGRLLSRWVDPWLPVEDTEEKL